MTDNICKEALLSNGQTGFGARICEASPTGAVCFGVQTVLPREYRSHVLLIIYSIERKKPLARSENVYHVYVLSKSFEAFREMVTEEMNLASNR